MKEYSSFETVKVSLAKELDGLDDEIDLGAGNWITFGYIPSDVRVFFALDNNSNSKIQAKQGLQIKVPHSKVYLWSTGTNDTEEMEIMHWGSNDIEMIMPPRSDFDSLNGYGSLALSQLDKIINPYNFTTRYSAENNNTSEAEVLSKTLDCDKIKVNLFMKRELDGLYIFLYINGNLLCKSSGFNDANGRLQNNFQGEFIVNRGDILSIKCTSADSTNYTCYAIEEYTLK